ncbi:hypothetical protein [Modestobacter sp. URMC 112]
MGRAFRDDDVRLVKVSDWTFYRREESIRDLLPYSSKEIEISVRVGLTEAQTQQLSREIGASVGRDKVAGASARLSEAFQRTVSLELRSTRTETDTITNESPRPRRIAIWHVVHRVAVEVLGDGEQGLRWVEASAFEHVVPGHRYSELVTDRPAVS